MAEEVLVQVLQVQKMEDQVVVVILMLQEIKVVEILPQFPHHKVMMVQNLYLVHLIQVQIDTEVVVVALQRLPALRAIFLGA